MANRHGNGCGGCMGIAILGGLLIVGLLFFGFISLFHVRTEKVKEIHSQSYTAYERGAQPLAPTISATEYAGQVNRGLSWFAVFMLVGLAVLVLLPVVAIAIISRRGSSATGEANNDLRQAIDDLHQLSERLIKRVDNLETILREEADERN